MSSLSTPSPPCSSMGLMIPSCCKSFTVGVSSFFLFPSVSNIFSSRNSLISFSCNPSSSTSFLILSPWISCSKVSPSIVLLSKSRSSSSIRLFSSLSSKLSTGIGESSIPPSIIALISGMGRSLIVGIEYSGNSTISVGDSSNSVIVMISSCDILGSGISIPIWGSSFIWFSSSFISGKSIVSLASCSSNFSVSDGSSSCFSMFSTHLYPIFQQTSSASRHSPTLS